MLYSLPALALCNYAVHLVESAIGARSAVLDNIAADLSRSTTLTRLGSPSLDGPAAKIA